MVRRCSLLVLISLVSLSFACRNAVQGAEQREWLAVMELKRQANASAAAGGAAQIAARQAYADGVARFVARHPSDGRARIVYRGLQLEFARELMRAGRSDDAIRYYRAVVAADADAAAAQKELAAALDRREVRAAELAAIPLGATKEDVTARLGPPRPGWTRSVVENGRRTDCWYYPAGGSAAAGIFFADGRVFATEYGGKQLAARPPGQ